MHKGRSLWKSEKSQENGDEGAAGARHTQKINSTVIALWAKCLVWCVLGWWGELMFVHRKQHTLAPNKCVYICVLIYTCCGCACAPIHTHR